ncbi:MAG: hypothetical protein SH818_03330 [Saprospiraceae bacterium]|nr:hypothetical protein [Saprospiraceae bacterium]
MNTKIRKWNALIQVVSVDCNSPLGFNKAAWVTAICLARSIKDVRELVKEQMECLNLKVKVIERIEIFDLRKRQFKLKNKLHVRASKLTSTKPIIFGNFNAY